MIMLKRLCLRHIHLIIRVKLLLLLLLLGNPINPIDTKKNYDISVWERESTVVGCELLKSEI